MADIRKDQERDELHRAIWAIADGLRGSVDGWDFKSMMFSGETMQITHLGDSRV